MKKIAYIAPEMEVVELKNTVTLLAGSPDGSGSSSDPNNPEEAEDGDY